jgi:hypothetical protein
MILERRQVEGKINVLIQERDFFEDLFPDGDPIGDTVLNDVEDDLNYYSTESFKKFQQAMDLDLQILDIETQIKKLPYP